jgi:hypothetical protein
LRSAPVSLERLEISNDPRNFDPDEANPIIASIDELIPTKRRMYVRKSDIPNVVVWILVAFATGLVQRIGEVATDRMLESLHGKLSQRVSLLLSKSKASERPDVIFSVTVPDSNAIIEGAVESASGQMLERVWPSLPELYCFALSLVRRNRKNLFSQLKFLFNPVTNKWEINYLLTKGTNRVILGPRYYERAHPLWQRWEDERVNYGVSGHAHLGMSIGFRSAE